eukprot:TRINITY_DN69185_c0_g1_i1.p1 TRINITY_DN69185_c0_g1~~TRINITY_DN69185_c0_g1_i1.p1  ORF type:complete len:108 (-),score=6.49 TRINITY_DN69185_c0_g1_i1:1000-1323(-)
MVTSDLLGLDMWMCCHSIQPTCLAYVRLLANHLDHNGHQSLVTMVYGEFTLDCIRGSVSYLLRAWVESYCISFEGFGLEFLDISPFGTYLFVSQFPLLLVYDELVII